MTPSSILTQSWHTLSGLWLFVFVAIVITIAAALFQPRKRLPQYRKKEFVMSSRERIWFETISRALGNEYLLFPQMHFDTLIEPISRNRKDKFGERARISQKSVDFVVCNRQLQTLLAIELNDRSHDYQKRISRDTFEGKIFADAGLSLLRLRHQDPQDVEKLREILAPYLVKTEPVEATVPN